LGAFEPYNGGLLIANLKCYLGIVLEPPQRQHAIHHLPMSQFHSWFICSHASGPAFTQTTLKTLGAFEPCNGGLLIANLKCYLGIVLEPPQRQHAIRYLPMSQFHSWFICGHAHGV
jgi:hypothetical protein